MLMKSLVPSSRVLLLAQHSLVVVSGSGNITAVAGPVGVHKLARLRYKLVRVRAEVITLRLQIKR